MTNKQGSKGWQVIPCQGWNILDGCDGVGSWYSFYIQMSHLISESSIIEKIETRIKIIFFIFSSLNISENINGDGISIKSYQKYLRINYDH